VIPIRDEIPTRITPAVTYALLAACVLVFLWQASLGERDLKVAIYAFGMIPATLFGHAHLPESVAQVPPEVTVFTSMFLHGGWMHLLGNPLYLWIFGNNVEEAMGHARYVIFYLICGTAAALAQAFPDPASEVPMVGASGAISGVLGAYLLLYPHARVLVLVPLGALSQLAHLPAAWVLGFWFVLQLVSTLLAGDQQGGIAFGAHLGGFVAGLALVALFKRAEVPLLGRRR
jgi:membrane associated rhomboid family serine protease